MSGATIVIGAGKASGAMAKALEDAWDGPLEGLVVTRYGYRVPTKRLEVVEAAHPVPDAAGREASRAHVAALLRDHQQLARFKREAEMSSRLSHPNTVQVFDFGEQEGELYMAMELLEGHSLADLIHDAPRMPVARAVGLAVDQRAAVERSEQPLVRIDDEAVGVLDAAVAIAHARCGQPGAAVSTVDMHPDVELGADLGRLDDLVNAGLGLVLSTTSTTALGIDAKPAVTIAVKAGKGTAVVAGRVTAGGQPAPGVPVSIFSGAKKVATTKNHNKIGRPSFQ